MKIYLATRLEDTEKIIRGGYTLTKMGSDYRLISYFFLKTLKSIEFKEYILTGILKK